MRPCTSLISHLPDEGILLMKALPLDSTHSSFVFWFREGKSLNPLPTHHPTQSRHRRHEIHHREISLQRLNILIHVFALFQPTEWLTKHEGGDGVKGEILSQECEIDSAFLQILSFDQIDKRVNSSVYVRLEVWVVFSRILGKKSVSPAIHIGCVCDCVPQQRVWRA